MKAYQGAYCKIGVKTTYIRAKHSVYDSELHTISEKTSGIGCPNMKCPYCGSESKTLETRDSPENTTRRRKECITCGKRFTTYEYVETIEMMVRKKDDKLERFDANKIIRGLQKACEKRPLTMEQIHQLSGRVRQDLMLKGKEEVTSQEIGDLVMKYLKDLDRIAYIRFASVYKKFEEPEDFRQLLLEVKKE